jgi:hypothetical protein
MTISEARNDLPTRFEGSVAPALVAEFGDRLTEWARGYDYSTAHGLQLKVYEGAYYSPEYSFQIRLRFGGVSVLSFDLSPYPDCCAMWQINHFSCIQTEWADKFVADAMNGILRLIQGLYSDSLKRFVFNFVERPRMENGAPKHRFGDIPDVAGTDLKRMYYAPLYKWATSHKHQQLLTVNHNTGNIIHFVDVMVGTL